MEDALIDGVELLNYRLRANGKRLSAIEAGSRVSGDLRPGPVPMRQASTRTMPTYVSSPYELNLSLCGASLHKITSSHR